MNTPEPTDSIFASQAEQQARLECSTPDRYGHKEADLCYYERAQRICDDDQLWNRFVELSGGLPHVHSPSSSPSASSTPSASGVLQGAAPFLETLGLCRGRVDY